MSKESAGLLMYRSFGGVLQFLLIHPGGPFWRNKDAGAWSIPKGELAPGEDPLMAAIREFEEELGSRPVGPFEPLGTVRQKAGKQVHAWACEGNLDSTTVRSNNFEMEWPPGSGKKQLFPEIDRAEFFPSTVAKVKINPAQVALLDQCAALNRGEAT